VKVSRFPAIFAASAVVMAVHRAGDVGFTVMSPRVIGSKAAIGNDADMNPRKDSVPGLQLAPRRPYSGWAVVLKSIVASLILLGAVGTTQYFLSGGVPWFLHKSGDNVDTAEVNARAAAFAALEPIRLSLVPAADLAKAIDSMGLDAAGKAAMMANVQSAPDPKVPEPTAAASAPSSHPAQPARLAWITLWDTDAEDGDAVRIDSQGYSRTVTLTKQPVTFAIPVPLDGVVKVTGIRDGEGGGITVGFASGTSRAPFPIMSVGQTLGLKVRLD
jgi:hypothetical protein